MNRAGELRLFINHELTTLAQKTRTFSEANELNWAVQSETLYAEILSIVFDCELRNLNFSASAHTIDLSDPEARIAVQVTVNDRHSKIAETLKSFHKKTMYRDYHNLYILVIRSERKHYRNLPTYNTFSFDPNKNILQIPDIYSMISVLKIEKLRKIVEIIQLYNGPGTNPILLSSDIWDFDPIHRKRAYLRYLKSFASALDGAIRPSFTESYNPDPTSGELDLPMFHSLARLWISRAREFGLGFVLDLSLEQIASIQEVLRAAKIAEVSLDAFNLSFVPGEMRDMKLWGELQKNKTSLDQAISRLEIEFRKI